MGANEMQAMLEQGFDDTSSSRRKNPRRHDTPPRQYPQQTRYNGYPPVPTMQNSVTREWQGASSAVETRQYPGHAKKRSAGGSGPVKPGAIFRP